MFALPSTKEIKTFFFSQYFSDGLRVCIGVLVPALVMIYTDHFDFGIALALGAICIVVVDNPGPVIHKRNAMAVASVCMFIVALATGYSRPDVIALGIVITFFAFVFSMFTVYGNRAASVGTASLLIMIFMIAREIPMSEVFAYSATIFAGGVWYMVFSLVFFGIRPYRAAQQALGENIAEIVGFLRIKADFYKPDTDIDDNYHKLVLQQIKVSQHQDAVRELLFKSRLMVRESTNASRILVLTFIDLVDMFEYIMATHYDYNYLRDKFKDSNILPEIAGLINKMADELDHMGFAVLSNTRYNHLYNFEKELEQLKLKIDEVGKNSHETSNLVLKKILINLRDLNKEIDNIYNYYRSSSSKILIENNNNVDHSKFVTHQDYAPHIFFDNLTRKSAAFKHAARVAFVCFIGFIISKNLPLGHHSYWILLTIIVILKPGFSLSKQRNYQRLIGTIVGVAIGVIILLFIKNHNVQFAFMVVFMIGAYSFIRTNYVVSITFMTPYVLIMLKFLGVGQMNIVEERILDTVIGSTIAFLGSYLIFPTWEFEKIRKTMTDVLYANINYLVKVAESVTGKGIDITAYKLARKDVFIKSANLSAAFERMTSEPKSKQRNITDIHKFVVLNHILSSYIATIASEVAIKGIHKAQPDSLKLIKKSFALLNESSTKLGGKKIEFISEKHDAVIVEVDPATLSTADILLKDQLGFINKISTDIAKVTDNVVGKEDNTTTTPSPN